MYNCYSPNRVDSVNGGSRAVIRVKEDISVVICVKRVICVKGQECSPMRLADRKRQAADGQKNLTAGDRGPDGGARRGMSEVSI